MRKMEKKKPKTRGAGVAAGKKNSGAEAERAAGVGVQVNGRGPRTPCYSTIDDGARDGRRFQTFAYLFK